MGFRVHLSVICFHLATRFLEMAIGVLSVQFGQGNSVATPQFAIETPIFIVRQADSHESLEFPIRANHPIRANRANRFARITPLRPHNCPRRGGNLERGKKALSSGDRQFGRHSKREFGRGCNRKSKIAARQWGVNSCYEAFRCLAGPESTKNRNRNMPRVREEHSMDQYRSRPKLSENFEGHWSIPFPGENSYGPIIGPYLFLGKFIWTNGPESSSKVSPHTGIGPWMALASESLLQTSPSGTLLSRKRFNRNLVRTGVWRGF